jgi:glutamine synthetase
VPTQAINDMAKDGAGFAGFATWLDLTPAHPDMMAVPDPDSVIQLPWKKEVAWVAAALHDGGQTGRPGPAQRAGAPDRRGREGRPARQDRGGARVLPPVPDGTRDLGPYDTAVKPCYDQQAVMRRYDVIAEICDYMLELGWEPLPERPRGRERPVRDELEVRRRAATADKHSFFKFMVKSVAEKHGLRATFMPKPFKGLTGSGCHAHISVWTPGRQDQRLRRQDRRSWACRQGALPRRDHEARHRAGGDHQPDGEQLQADQRAAHLFSGATWAPNTVTWTGNNRTHMVRVPGPGRFELRLPDGAANPYLLQAVIIAAGPRRVRTKADPGKRTTSTCMPRATR